MSAVLSIAVAVLVVGNLWLFWRVLSDVGNAVSVLLGERKNDRTN